ncbi:hypothetical protein ACQ86N_14000 [Puia sp. P3]|uniref:hypothetical protein n=1 Tax=Puia sp. P3 TaxID=3423952 RepID=UPI003D678A1F
MAKTSRVSKPKASATTDQGLGIKYSDKSAGQPALTLVFDEIKKLMIPYAKDSLVLKGGTDGQIALITNKPVVIQGRKRNELWFVSMLIQKGYVGFYYMPVYMNEPVRRQLQPELLKTLKGKACFHIKNTDPPLLAQIEEALRIGYNAYKKMGWI